MYRARVLKVMIASPGDVPAERQAVREVVHEWNAVQSADKGIVLLTLLKIILSLREGALTGAKIQTSSGDRMIADQLEALVSTPKVSHDAGRPIAKKRSARAVTRGDVTR